MTSGYCALCGKPGTSLDPLDKLHVMGQRLAMEQQGWTEEEFRRIFGRSYL